MRRFIFVLLILAIVLCFSSIAFAGDKDIEKTNVFVGGGVMAGIITLLTGQLKKISFIPKEIAPVIALILGVAGGIAAHSFGMTVDLTFGQSVIGGAGSGGLATLIHSLTGIRGKKTK